MLKVRYNTQTKEVTGWCGDSTQFDNLKDRGGEATAIIDIPIPDKPLEAWLYDEATQSLVNNLNYVEPIPPRNLGEEIDHIKAKLKEAGIAIE